MPEQDGFATKPALATTMITAALDAGVPAGWVAGDEVYGADPLLRSDLEQRRVGYVLAVACSHRLPTPAGVLRADTLAAHVPRRAWHRYCAGAGTKGHRYHDWALIDAVPTSHGGCHQLLIRRHRRSGKLAYFRCYSPHPVPLATLVRIAGRRWTVEQSFQTGKGLAGLDEHQVRRWTSWHAGSPSPYSPTPSSPSPQPSTAPDGTHPPATSR